MNDDLLTEDEHEAIMLAGRIAELASRIIGDGPNATNDAREVCAAIHVIQATFMAQAAARAFPDRYRLLGDSIGGGR